MSNAHVFSVRRDLLHRFSMVPFGSIALAAALGMVRDAHAGTLVQHRSRGTTRPERAEPAAGSPRCRRALRRAAERGHPLGLGDLGDLGEDIATEGVPLLSLPVGTRLQFGEVAVRLTGLCHPCRQISDFQPGPLKVVVARADGLPSTSEPTLTPPGGVDQRGGARIVGEAGVMGVVEHGGGIRAGQSIDLVLPDEPHRALEPV